MTAVLHDLSNGPCYDLDARESAALHELVREHLGGAADRSTGAICVAVDGADPIANLGRALEQRIFDAEAGDHSPEVMHAEYGPYEDRSIFFLAIDLATASVVGVLRCITGTAGFGQPVKSIRDAVRIRNYADDFIDLTEGSISLDAGLLGRNAYANDALLSRGFVERYHGMRAGEGIFDVATLAVDTASRRSQMPVAHLLIAGCIRGMSVLAMRHTTTFVRSDLLGYLRETLNLPWSDLAGLGETQYVDGDPFLSQPAYLDFGALERMLSQARVDRSLGRPQKHNPEFERFVELVGSHDFDEVFLIR